MGWTMMALDSTAPRARAPIVPKVWSSCMRPGLDRVAWGFRLGQSMVRDRSGRGYGRSRCCESNLALARALASRPRRETLMSRRASSLWSPSRLAFLSLALGAISCSDPVASPSSSSPPLPPVTEPARSIRVDPSGASLRVAETIELHATFLGNSVTSPPTVSWSTSDSNIASVSADGLVTAKAPGSVSLTATAGGLSASIVVSVRGPREDMQ